MEDNPKSDFIEKGKANAKSISNAIGRIEYFHVDSKEKSDEFREQSKSIVDMFKNLRPLLREDREELWSKFNAITLRAKEENEKRRTQRFEASRRKKEIVISTIREASNYIGNNNDSLKQADDLLKKAFERMKDGWSEGFSTMDSLFHTSDGRMTKEDKEECWNYWQEVKDKIKYKREDFYRNNYSVAKSLLSSVANSATYGKPNEALREIREVRGKLRDLYMKKEQREEIHSGLNKYAETAFHKMDEMKKEREKKQKEWEERKREKEKRQKEWEERKKDKERKQKEWEERQREKERKKREYEERKREYEREKERKHREWQLRQIEKERRQQEREERQRESERKHREWEERKEEQRRRYEERKSRGGRKKGGCFITTAVCQSINKPDDCEELTAIRDFRDCWLAMQVNGQDIIDYYYDVSPQIVKNINLQPDKEEIYQKIWQSYLIHFFKSIQSKNYTKAKRIYLSMVNNLFETFVAD